MTIPIRILYIVISLEPFEMGARVVHDSESKLSTAAAFATICNTKIDALKSLCRQTSM